MMISAVFDACVLYPAPLRDFLLRIAFAGFIQPFWSDEIQNEWTHSLLRKHTNLMQEKLERTRREMDFHFPNGSVRGYESIVPKLELPDPKDRHVLAVAIHGKAKYIVTFNLADFPKSALAPYQVEAISPDDFILLVIEYNTTTFIETIARHRAVLKHPPKTADEYLATLEKQRLPKTVAFLREHKGEI